MSFILIVTRLFNSGLINFIIKQTLAQVFSCEFGKIFKNTFFIEKKVFSAEYRNVILPFRVR